MGRVVDISEQDYRALKQFVSNSDLSNLSPQKAEMLKDAFRFGTGFHENTQGLPLSVELSRLELKKVRNMSRAFWANPFVKELWSRSTVVGIEIKYVCDENGTRCMCDWMLRRDDGKVLIIELKSTSCASARDFQEKAREYDYPRAAVHYLETTEADYHVVIGVQKDEEASKIFTFVTKRGGMVYDFRKKQWLKELNEYNETQNKIP